LKITVLAFGKLRTPGLGEADAYYRKLLGAWATAEEVELKPVPVPDKSAVTRARIQAKEAEILFGKLSPRTALYLLDEKGKGRATAQWASLVNEWEGGSIPEVALAIGSSLGFSEEVRARARGLLSLGPQTLPHELARVVLWEQLYRAWSVTRGHPYHVEG
jgi:23S rRNA (pseudouridine1915-N3)-methyltransferase